MAWNKAIFFFSDGKFGWTEVYYDSSPYSGPPVSQADLLTTFKKAVSLAYTRRAMLAGGSDICKPAGCNAPQLTTIRVSTVGSRRQSYFNTPESANLNNLAGLPSIPPKTVASGNGVWNQPPSVPYNAIELYSQLTGGGHVTRAIRGIPKEYICDFSLDNNNPVVNAIKNFAADLTSQGWGSLSTLGPENNRILPQGNPPTNTSLANAVMIAPVTGLNPLAGGITQDSMGRPIVTLVTPMTLPTGASCCNGFRLSITCYIPNPGTPNINGTYSAVPTLNAAGQAVSFLLRKVFKPLSPFCVGWVVPYNPQVLAFLKVKPIRPMKKDTGRPTDLVRGRARVRR